MSINKSEDGFTLVETLLVLFIVSCTFLIPVLAIDKMIEQTTVDLFFRELTGNITMAHTHAVVNGDPTKVEFRRRTDFDDVNFTVMQQPDHPLNKQLILNKDYYYFHNRNQTIITFKRYTGNISGSVNIRFGSVNGDYRLTYWLGSGRFEITKTSTQ